MFMLFNIKKKLGEIHSNKLEHFNSISFENIYYPIYTHLDSLEKLLIIQGVLIFRQTIRIILISDLMLWVNPHL